MVDDRIVTQAGVVELVSVAMEDRDGAGLIVCDMAERLQDADLPTEDLAAGVVALRRVQAPARAITLQDFGRLLVTHQLQCIVDQDQADAAVEGAADEDFPTRAVQLLGDGNDQPQR
jgi:hypothetical protein